ncbi:MAG: NAD(P)/FAD-dependent oxidoreductase [Candidatus Omnitrophica bacterium]|nr:NAD(P)/FAD-dependent oxidoreductase [Candidatus Omnitrophota bacterium]
MGLRFYGRANYIKMDSYDIAVIGAGAAGSMAAIRAGQSGKKVTLLERNEILGRKILMTGRGRCNITNSGKLDTFIEKFGKRPGQFLRNAFYKFSNEDVMDFFRSKGLELKSERQGRVFPLSDNARSVTQVLEKCLEENKVDVRYKIRIREIRKDGENFILDTDGGPVTAKKIILATGGASYKDTGSTGDGFQIAQALGHAILPLKPGLVPLKTKETWVKEVQGLTLKNIRLIFVAGKKKIISDVGELLFTHFGVSGPLVLDLSADIVRLLSEEGQMNLLIDLKPGIDKSEMDDKLLREIKEHGGREIKTMLAQALPLKLAPLILKLVEIDLHKKVHQMNKDDRRKLAKILKELPLTIAGSLPLEEAMVTCGGVAIKEIDPRTMESRVIPGLYFAGEVIEGGAPSGGYNLQQAFSTGYLAGESAANA